MIARLRTQWGLPIWSFGLAIALLLIGAAVLVITGRMEQRRRAGNAPAGLARLFTWRNAVAGGVAALALWAVAATGVAMRGPSARAAGEGVRLAVLPFENRGSAEDGYFADGIADEIRGKLTGLPGFRVTARTSSDQYRTTTKTLKEIGSELSADYLLTATVRWARTPDGKGQVQVVPELIDARTGEATWQQSFDADVTNVFEVQSAIASKVAVALGVALGKSDEQQLAERPTENVAAYDIYLKGKALSGADPVTLKQRAGFMEQAVALDPKFAAAWSDLAVTLSNLYTNGTPDPMVGARAKEAAEQGLALGKNGATGHAAMSRYHLSVRKDVARAEEEMMLALNAAPNDPRMLRAVGVFEETLGRWDDAAAHLERARRLDPRAPLAGLRELYVRTRQYDKAMAVGAEALALDPGDLNNLLGQATMYLAQGDLPAARKVITDAPGALARPALLAYFGIYYDLYWVLTTEQQDLMLRSAALRLLRRPGGVGLGLHADLLLAGRQGAGAGIRRYGARGARVTAARRTGRSSTPCALRAGTGLHGSQGGGDRRG